MPGVRKGLQGEDVSAKTQGPAGVTAQSGEQAKGTEACVLGTPSAVQQSRGVLSLVRGTQGSKGYSPHLRGCWGTSLTTPSQ